MKIKVSEATLTQLNWLVAKCEGGVGENQLLGAWYAPSTNWSQGGPIIERERINLWNEGYEWEASLYGNHIVWGETPLVAAMRCYVSSKLGDKVEIPEEIV